MAPFVRNNKYRCPHKYSKDSRKIGTNIFPVRRVNLSSLPVPVILGADIAGLAIIILMMSINGDFNLIEPGTAGRASESGISRTAAEGIPPMLNPEDALARIMENYHLTPRETDVLRELVLTEDKQSDPEIRPAASAFFFITSVPLIFFVSNSIFASAMHSVKDTRTPMIMNLSANVLNAGLNYLFIYRLNLGTNGAAYATAISTVFGGIGMFAAYRRKPELRIKARDLFVHNTDLLKKVLHVALPVTGTTIVSCMGYIVFSGMVNSMGVKVFAAHSIALTAEEIFYLPGYGIRTATSALIGISLGERDQQKFNDIRQISLTLTALLMLVSGTALFLAAYPLMEFFTNDADVIHMGAICLKMVAFIEPFFGVMVAWQGISYGTGQTRSVFVIEACSMWGIRILCTFLVIRAGLGLTAVWGCMMADNVTKAVALTIYGLTHPVDVNKSAVRCNRIIQRTIPRKCKHELRYDLIIPIPGRVHFGEGFTAV